MNEWLSGWMNGCELMNVWMNEWLNGWMNEQLNEWVIDRLVDWLVDWLIDWLIDWTFDIILVTTTNFFVVCLGTFVPEKDCTTVPCLNGGSCLNDDTKKDGNTKSCKCPKFFTGKQCETDAGTFQIFQIQNKIMIIGLAWILLTGSLPCKN